MNDVINIAAYIAKRYLAEYKEEIDEMKLHKLLYFAQREAFILLDQPLFKENFYGWKYGPVLKEIRSAYKDNIFKTIVLKEIDKKYDPIFDKVFEEYAEKSSWSLSRLTHGELSWKNSRKGVSEETNSDNIIKTTDIKKDALRVKERRDMLNKFKIS